MKLFSTPKFLHLACRPFDRLFLFYFFWSFRECEIKFCTKSFVWKSTKLFAYKSYLFYRGHEWSSLRVEFHSDNQAVVSSLHKGSCRCSNVMSLLRRLFLVCALQNFNVSASYVKGVSNGIADSLSRQDFGRFRTLAPQAAAIPDTTRPLPNVPGEPSLVPCTSTHSNR